MKPPEPPETEGLGGDLVVHSKARVQPPDVESVVEKKRFKKV